MQLALLIIVKIVVLRVWCIIFFYYYFNEVNKPPNGQRNQDGGLQEINLTDKSKARAAVLSHVKR